MNVGYVLRYWPALSETFVAREIGELLRRGARVTVFSLGSRDDGALAEVPDVPVLSPPRGARSWLTIPTRGTGRRWGMRGRDVRRAAWIGARARALGLERLHAHFVGEAAEAASIAAEIAGIPWSVTAHAVDLFVPRPSVAELLREARPAITICEHHRRWIAERYGVDAAVVRCGVPLDVPQADPGSPGARFVSVARDVPKKGLPALVDAIRATEGATLRLVSDAHHLAGAGVTAGFVPPSAVPGVLAEAHVFALPCRVAPSGDRDGVPVAILEAMAAGLPVLTTAVSGVPEVVDDEVGWLVPPDDPAALRGAVRAALDPGERARRGAAARRRIEQAGWTVEGQVDGLVAAWRSVTAP